MKDADRSEKKLMVLPLLCTALSVVGLITFFVVGFITKLETGRAKTPGRSTGRPPILTTAQSYWVGGGLVLHVLGALTDFRVRCIVPPFGALHLESVSHWEDHVPESLAFHFPPSSHEAISRSRGSVGPRAWRMPDIRRQHHQNRSYLPTDG